MIEEVIFENYFLEEEEIYNFGDNKIDINEYFKDNFYQIKILKYFESLLKN